MKLTILPMRNFNYSPNDLDQSSFTGISHCYSKRVKLEMATRGGYVNVLYQR